MFLKNGHAYSTLRKTSYSLVLEGILADLRLKGAQVAGARGSGCGGEAMFGLRSYQEALAMEVQRPGNHVVVPWGPDEP